MKAIQLGNLDRILGRAWLVDGEWYIEPHDGTEEEARRVLNRVFTYVQRNRPPLTPAQFLALFYDYRKGPPIEASRSSTSWATRTMPQKPQELAPLVQRIQQEIRANYYAEREREK